MFELIRENKRRSGALIGGFLVIATVIGALVGWLAGNAFVAAAVALVVSTAVAWAAHLWADAVVLRVSRADPADPQRYQRLYNLVESLCIASGLPVPAVYVIEDSAPNALATGRDPKHASIAVTTGLLENLNRVELEGVVAHELSRIRHRDTLVSDLAAVLLGSVVLVAGLLLRLRWRNGGRVAREGDPHDRRTPLAWFGYPLLVLAPPTGRVLRLLVHRERVTAADVAACQLTRYPPGLIAALEKLRDSGTVVRSALAATGHVWLDQALAGVGDRGRWAWLNRRFDTHPGVDERIALLREL